MGRLIDCCPVCGKYLSKILPHKCKGKEPR